MNGKQKTFAVALSRQMAPTAHIVAYCIVQGEVVTDALSFYVHDTRLMQVRLITWPFDLYLYYPSLASYQSVCSSSICLWSKSRKR